MGRFVGRLHMEIDNKKITINTLIIYIRLAVTTIIGLFSMRFVMQELGASDYGLYNVVGSIIIMANTLGIALTTTTRRYINIEMGKPGGNLQKIFNICLFVHVLFAIFMFAFIEIVGTWYIDNFLNVASEKLSDARFVFQISTIVACIGIIIVPYQSLLEAFQKFGQVAIVDISNAILKFIFVLLMVPYEGNELRFYAVSMSLLTASSFVFYHLFCYFQHRDIIRRSWVWDKALFKEIIVFNNYTALGATTFIARSQCTTMIVNYFFGTIVNAAFAIAFQIQNYVQLFVNNIATASSPQIVQLYGSGKYDQAVALCSKVNRITILLMMSVIISLLVEIKYILSLWLGEYPEGTLIFCTWTLIYALTGAYFACVSTIIQASGKVKYFQLLSTAELIILPISYYLYEINYPPVTITVCIVIYSILSKAIELYMMNRIIGFDSISFIKESYTRPTFILIILIGWFYFYESFLLSAVHPILGVFITILFSGTLCFFYGLYTNERSRILKMLVDKIHMY